MNRPTLEGPWAISFDEQGDVDGPGEAELVGHIGDAQITDLVLFCHGWNNDEAAATSLYVRWFELLGSHIGPGHTVGFVGVRWPSQLWRDEPIPDFDPAPSGVSNGAAGLVEAAHTVASDPALTPRQLRDLVDLFPDGAEVLDEIASLLTAGPSGPTVDEIFDALRRFSDAIAAGSNDGESADSARPGMLGADETAAEVFGTFADALTETGVDLGTEGGGGGAGFHQDVARLLHGAKEALRQLTYWQMKKRAGVVGEHGVGPLLGRISASFGTLRIHLVGHSFGGRVVSYALAGGPDVNPSPIKSVTLLEGAFSRFAFTEELPFDSVRSSGALAGTPARVDGPLTVCFSSHDMALGVMYPLASAAAREDSAGISDPLFRWRAMGSLGAFGARTEAIGSVGTSYPFSSGQLLNIDSSAVVTVGSPPSGAHSDIFHDELAWIVASAATLTA